MSTATHASPPITLETRIGDIVAARPALAQIFEELDIDYCCGGKQTLSAAIVGRDLSPATVVAMLNAASVALASTPAQIDPAKLSLTELADHIEATHHAYLKTALPRLVEQARRVAGQHGERDPRLVEVAATVIGLTEEMLMHLQKEELILFPLVRRIDANTGGISAVALTGPILQMEIEHTSAGEQTARLRQLTDDFTPSAATCNTHAALLDGLAAFETDLHNHVHKENNILFPRALARASGRQA